MVRAGICPVVDSEADDDDDNVDYDMQTVVHLHLNFFYFLLAHFFTRTAIVSPYGPPLQFFFSANVIIVEII